LSDTAGLLPENVIRDLVGEAYCRLDPIAQQVLQALAVYNRPVSPTPIDYLLQPYLPGVNSAPVLGRLVNLQFARREGRRYYLHPVDRAYAFERIPEGSEADRAVERPPFTRFALLHRGAEYFKQARTPEENRKAIDDLRPQLIEFELRYAGRDYDAAAEVLLDFDFDYLLLWGHYRLMAELHERLQGKINDSRWKQWSIGNLGTAYRRMGQFQRAIDCYQQALACARTMQDRPGEDVWLGNLGRAYADLGQIIQAMRCYELALEIDREVDDLNGEWIDLYNLGNSYLALGQTDRAMSNYEQSLAIAREIEDLGGEEANLGKLGSCYAILGQVDRAMDHHQQALASARELGDRNGMAKHLANLALVLIDQQRYAEAIQHASESVNIADEMNSPHRSNQSAYSLALAQLCAGNLPAARTAAEVARKHDDPENNHNVLALLGLIALRQGDRAAAHESFATAITQADTLLAHTPQFYKALDAKGLALCGLALIEGPRHLPEAIAAYQAARSINKDTGVVARVLRLFDALAVADAGGMLAGVRAAAGGEPGLTD
jgi:tetratricopeptide (TPR) repeat protein